MVSIWGLLAFLKEQPQYLISGGHFLTDGTNNLTLLINVSWLSKD